MISNQVIKTFLISVLFSLLGEQEQQQRPKKDSFIPGRHEFFFFPNEPIVSRNDRTQPMKWPSTKSAKKP